MVEVYVRKKSGTPAGALLVTFVLGVGIGFSLGYAIFGIGVEKATQPPMESPDVTQTAAVPSEPAASTSDIASTEGSEVSAEPAESGPEPAQSEPTPVEPAASTSQPEAQPPILPALAEGDVWPGRVVFMAVSGTALDDVTRALLAEVKPLGVVLREENLTDSNQIKELVSQIKSAVGFGGELFNLPLIAIDPDEVTLAKLGVASSPSASEIGAKRETEAARTMGRTIAEASVAHGIGVVLAPALDVLPLGLVDEKVVARSYGSNQELVAVMGLAYADGVMDAKAVPVAKRYPAVGQRKEADGKTYDVVEVATTGELAERMYPFSEATNQGIPGLLAGMVAAPILDSRNPRLPAALSPVLVNRVVREHWKYGGVILADDLALNSMTQSIPVDQVLLQAMSAGCDAALFLDPSADRVRAACAGIQIALDNGALPKERLLESRDRFDMWQARLGRTEKMKATAPETAAREPSSPEPAAAEPDSSAAQAAEQPAVIEAKPVDQPEGQESKEEASAETAEPNKEAPSESKEPEKKDEETKSAESKAKPVEQPSNTEKIIHTIEPGESLSKIASKYGVNQSDILAWNKMKDTTVKYGFKLTIFKPVSAAPEENKPKTDAANEPEAPEQPGPAEETKPAEESKPAEEPKTEVSVAEPSEARIEAPEAVKAEELAAPSSPMPAVEPPKEGTDAAPTPDATAEASGDREDSSEGKASSEEKASAEGKATQEYESYAVKTGDTAGSIAGKYGITVKELAELNGIENTDIVVTGHKLKVPKLPR